jgi:DNA repair exonuclease SbcCD ATPase subunit
LVLRCLWAESSAQLQWLHFAKALDLLEHWDFAQQLSRVKRMVEATPAPLWNVVAELGRQLREQQRQLAEQQQQLAEQRKELAQLKSQLEKVRGTPPVAPDEALRWIMENREKVAQHRGERIAVHPTRGIVASAPSYSRLQELLQQQGVQDDEVIIEFVPPRFSSK